MTNPKPSMDALLRFVENASDEEIAEMYRASGLDPDAVAKKIRRTLLHALPRSAARPAFSLVLAWKSALALATLVLVSFAGYVGQKLLSPIPSLVVPMSVMAKLVPPPISVESGSAAQQSPFHPRRTRRHLIHVTYLARLSPGPLPPLADVPGHVLGANINGSNGTAAVAARDASKNGLSPRMVSDLTIIGRDAAELLKIMPGMAMATGLNGNMWSAYTKRSDYVSGIELMINAIPKAPLLAETGGNPLYAGISSTSSDTGTGRKPYRWSAMRSPAGLNLNATTVSAHFELLPVEPVPVLVHVDRSLFDRVPKGRSFSDLVGLASGAGYEPNASGVQINGASGSENTYQIAGDQRPAEGVLNLSLYTAGAGVGDKRPSLLERSWNRLKAGVWQPIVHVWKTVFRPRIGQEEQVPGSGKTTR